MQLYKYMKKEHAESFIRDGDLQIGTLYYYRSIEKPGIGDKDEGTKDIYCNDLVVDSQNPNTPPEMLKKIGVDVDETSRFHAEHSYFRRREDSPDCYVFCTSEEYSTDLMREFDSDACVQIDQPRMFFRAITKCLFNRGLIRPRCLADKCIYTDRSQYYLEADEVHPTFIKAPCYEHQKEVRTVWIPRESKIEPIILRCRPVRKFCSLLCSPPVV